ncbi:hypothetical protein HPT27_12215 [Permianibacter sp. IMCC34836]|uniref:hypothetical protein n=1 Tax=Permianibacter fluminis TaxID=2738515 RepID=UPI0015529AFD|nr:hypothetical protein [Permianibacter fluminis]NQD37792.1 hypothetical protein [Permianibacter fluminis]
MSPVCARSSIQGQRLPRLALILTALLAPAASRGETLLVGELRALTGRSAGNPLEGELGKSPDDEQQPSGFLGLQARWDLDALTQSGLDLSAWQFNLSVLRYPSSEKPVALTEAFLRYRPIPDSAWRNQWRAGLFYAPLSLENSEALWQPQGFLSSSAINTWLGEEVRTTGIEWNGDWLGQRSGSDHDLGITLAVFCCNDPAGGLLSWRGWALHDRQYGWGEETEFAALPALTENGSFRSQEAYGSPFTEIDQRYGYYASLHWQHRGGIRIALSHYDNRGDPLAFEEGQWAWYTEFDQLSLKWQPSTDWTVLLQWLDGHTEFGRHRNRMIDNRFAAGFVSFARQWHQHRFSLRYDDFSVTDDDETPDDDNNEDGSAGTLAWQWQIDPNCLLLTEAMTIQSKRPARHYFGDAAEQSEHSLQIAIRFSW